jgi:Family of unknown function (DUF6263)
MRTTLFSAVRLGLFTASALAALVATTAQAQTALRWKFQKGETLKYSIVQKTASKLNANNIVIDVSVIQTIDTTWTVNAVSADGLAEVSQTFDRIQMNLEAPGSKIVYDSKDGKLPEGPQGQVLGPVLQALAGAEITFKMSERGEVTDVKLSDKVLEALKALPGGGAQGMFSEDSLKRMIMQSTLTLPEEAVARGKNWHKKTEMPAPPLGTMVIDNSYTYQGVDSATPGKLERIDVAVDTTLQPQENAPIQAKLKSQDSKGTFLFDNQKGYLSESGMTQKLEIVLSSMGKEFTQNQENSVTMKLSKAG